MVNAFEGYCLCPKAPECMLKTKNLNDASKKIWEHVHVHVDWSDNYYLIFPSLQML